MSKIFDTHTHVNFQPFKNEYAEILQSAVDAGVIINNVGSQWESSQESVRIADELTAKGVENIWASVGVHPIHVLSDITEEQDIAGKKQHIHTRAEEFDYQAYKKLAQSSDRVIGIGECGLDYYHFERPELNMTPDKQKELTEAQIDTFKQHLELARELDLALIVHCRDAAIHSEDSIAAFEDLLEVLRSYDTLPRFVIHCYTGLAKYIPQFIELGGFIGFTGIVSFPNAEEVRNALKATPFDRIVLETDAPYLAPVPHRGKRNEPLFVKDVAQAVADTLGKSIEEVAEQTTKNAIELFALR